MVILGLSGIDHAKVELTSDCDGQVIARVSPAALIQYALYSLFREETVYENCLFTDKTRYVAIHWKSIMGLF